MNPKCRARRRETSGEPAGSGNRLEVRRKESGIDRRCIGWVCARKKRGREAREQAAEAIGKRGKLQREAIARTCHESTSRGERAGSSLARGFGHYGGWRTHVHRTREASA